MEDKQETCKKAPESGPFRSEAIKKKAQVCDIVKKKAQMCDIIKKEALVCDIIKKEALVCVIIKKEELVKLEAQLQAFTKFLNTGRDLEGFNIVQEIAKLEAKIQKLKAE